MIQLLQMLALNVKNQGARFRGGPEKTVEQKKNFFFASVLQIQLYRKVLQKKRGGGGGGGNTIFFQSGVFSLMCSCKFA